MVTVEYHSALCSKIKATRIGVSTPEAIASMMLREMALEPESSAEPDSRLAPQGCSIGATEAGNVARVPEPQ